MENKQFPSRSKLLSIQEEKFIRAFDYDLSQVYSGASRLPRKELHLDLEIFKKNSSHRKISQRVLVSIKPRVPAIKTLFLAEKSRFCSRKGSDKSGSRLAIGDHSSFTTHLSADGSKILHSDTDSVTDELSCKSVKRIPEKLSQNQRVVTSSTESKCSHTDFKIKIPIIQNVFNGSAEKCFAYPQQIFTMNAPKIEAKIEKPKPILNKIDKATLIITNTTSEDSTQISKGTVDQLCKRINLLERKVLRQEMVFRSLDPNILQSSSDEESNCMMRSNSSAGRPGCSYIGQYSQVPETSAFQRCAHQITPLSPSKATTIEKEHNSEQYGRDFTAYDGLTARGRRQCASVPCKRVDNTKMAAERVNRIRQKLNPVRDYRLMDTVHYLAQGEFAPRDDGIKLTPSREAVLSDIIYEDVCRTHWPNTRLGRRTPHSERCSTRYELQRLIDSLLRDRVAHVERRRRRHYRIVKLNHRHESCRPLGKTGDIIVASHKNRSGTDEVVGSDHGAGNTIRTERRSEESPRRNHRSQDHMQSPDSYQKRRFRQEDCSPGPSYAIPRCATREPTCCYRTVSPTKEEKRAATARPIPGLNAATDMSSSSVSMSKQARSPRLVLKKEASRRKYHKDEPDLEHYILLPTLVVRTPSNVRRQKKFNELYHRILNVHLQNAADSPHCAVASERQTGPKISNTNKKDIGFNINVTLSNSEEKILNKKH